MDPINYIMGLEGTAEEPEGVSMGTAAARHVDQRSTKRWNLQGSYERAFLGGMRTISLGVIRTPVRRDIPGQCKRQRRADTPDSCAPIAARLVAFGIRSTRTTRSDSTRCARTSKPLVTAPKTVKLSSR